MTYSNHGFWHYVWKATARFRASLRSSSISTISRAPWGISANSSKTMGALFLQTYRWSRKKLRFISVMRFLPSDPRSWSPLILKVPRSSKSSGLQIVRPRLGKRILKILRLITFIVLAWLLIEASVLKPGTRPLVKMDSGCVISSMSSKICLTTVNNLSVKTTMTFL